MQGSKKWEVALQHPSHTKIQEEIVGVTWSPDVQSVAVASNPALLTVHSIQNGRVQVSTPVHYDKHRGDVCGVWWFREEKQVIGNGLPDIFKRGDNITGAAHSILRNLPLLDPVQDETKPLGSSELFAFQGARNRPVQKAPLPHCIYYWPTLPPDHTAASIAVNKPSAETYFQEAEQDEQDDTNTNSILAVADTLGYVHLYLEGTYRMGPVYIPHGKHFPRSFYKHREYFFSHIGPITPNSDGAVGLFPHIIKLPYLPGRHLRDVARASTVARELLSYALRVVKDMRAVWFGSETQVGARELGPKWVNALNSRQASAFGQDEPHAVLDLTCLLTTGRSSDGLMDFLGSGEHMSDRSIQKWETVMCEALIRLRDLSEKRVAPACQRLHLVLQDMQGWAALPQYAQCKIKPADIEACLELTATAIFQASWLANAARKELLRFKEFMKWIRYETARVNATGDHNSPRPQHDILEVNEYLASSLSVSPIDKWFVGTSGRINREGLGVPSENVSIKDAISKARAALDQWDQTVHKEVKPRDLSHIERNLDTLLTTLAEKCQKMFEEAARTACRTAELVAGPTFLAPTPTEGPDSSTSQSAASVPLIRERTPDNFLQYLAIRPPHDGGRSYLCVVRLQQGLGALTSVPTVEVAVLECSASEEGSEESVPFDLLDVDFFDSEVVVIVYRPQDQQTGARIATVGYANLIYHTIPSHEYVNGTTRETLMGDVLGLLASGQIPSAPAPIIQSRQLSGCTRGGASLAVNGRVGRRVACVLDEAGLTLEGEDDDGAAARLSDAALRKKKNADAQAAFRARRANYIATLEETVTNLESVVLQLQESCRHTETQLQETRQENSRLKTELEHKESLLRMYEHQKKVDREPQDDYPMSYAPVRTPPVTMNPSMPPAPPSNYGDDSMRYPSANHASGSMSGPSYNGQDYPQRSPALGYVSMAGGGSETRSMDGQARMARYDPYGPYPIDTSARDSNGWVGHAGTAVSDPGSMDSSSATHSPTFVESPTLTASDISYPSRYGVVEDQKVPLTPLATSPYMFAPSRSLSPAASTPSSASSMSIAPPSYSFTFPEGTSLADRPEFHGRRSTHAPELTLHGGTADVTTILNRMNSSRAAANPGPSSDRPVQAPSPYSRADNGSHERESDGESSSYTYSSRSRTRTSTVSRTSRSPSPGPPVICGTLAVIKAQAFGALRRTRGRSKKSSEGAAKAAVEALAARGIDVLANPAKRPRLHDSDGDLRI
ncbi:hypothetical protein L226DRAFT_451057 [Lentinus tigrinus ALCF2SS1-7]|uniref:uncharacterized protein n=1 Tax=Lentinus tigrinus ALCF2SS1-7 TaxID=1328758 RepID=UPI001165E655|nr:hypothetical protein L226DRAFT_451057 [Lentinus tigrinus ALCF2SS1-7]